MRENIYNGILLSVKPIKVDIFNKVPIQVLPGLYVNNSIYPIIPTNSNGIIEVIHKGILKEVTLPKLDKYRNKQQVKVYLEEYGTEVPVTKFLNSSNINDRDGSIRKTILEHIIVLYAVLTYSGRTMDHIESNFWDLLPNHTIEALDSIDYMDILIDEAYPDLIRFLNHASRRFPYNRIKVTLKNNPSFGEPLIVILVVEHNALYK